MTCGVCFRGAIVPHGLFRSWAATAWPYFSSTASICGMQQQLFYILICLTQSRLCLHCALVNKACWLHTHVVCVPGSLSSSQRVVASACLLAVMFEPCSGPTCRLACMICTAHMVCTPHTAQSPLLNTIASVGVHVQVHGQWLYVCVMSDRVALHDCSIVPVCMARCCVYAKPDICLVGELQVALAVALLLVYLRPPTTTAATTIYLHTCVVCKYQHYRSTLLPLHVCPRPKRRQCICLHFELSARLPFHLVRC